MEEKVNEQIDTADHVKHMPTGEEWVVACVVDGRLSWVGWPEGTAALRDCVLIRKASEESKLKLLQDMASMARDDHRARYAKQILNK